MAPWSLFNFSLKGKQRRSCSSRSQGPLLHPRQPLALQLFPHATRTGREQGGVGQGSIGLLGDVKPGVSFTGQPCGWKDGVGSPGSGALAAKHLTPARHFPHPPNAVCLATGLVAEKVALSLPARSRSTALEPAELPRRGELGRGRAGPQSAWAGKGLIRSGREQNLTKNRELLCEAKELVCLKTNYRAGWAVCCSPCKLQRLNPSRSIPRPPSTIPQLSRPSVFFVSRKCSCWQALAAPSSGRRRGLGPSQPRLCAGWVAQGALRAVRPRRQAEQSGPRATHCPGSFGFSMCCAPRGNGRQKSSPALMFLDSARIIVFLARSRSRVCSCWVEHLSQLLAGSTGLGTSPVREQM